MGKKKAAGNAENRMVTWSGNDLVGAASGTAAELPFV